MRIATPRGRLRSMGRADAPTRIVIDGVEAGTWVMGVLRLKLPDGTIRQEVCPLEAVAHFVEEAWPARRPDRR